jgi:hypothetical protein
MPPFRTPLTLDPHRLQSRVDEKAAAEVCAALETVLEAQAERLERNRRASLARLNARWKQIEPGLLKQGDIDPTPLHKDLAKIPVGQGHNQPGTVVGGIWVQRGPAGTIINYDPAIWVQNAATFERDWKPHFDKTLTLLRPLSKKLPPASHDFHFSTVVPRDGSASLEFSVVHQIGRLLGALESGSKVSPQRAGPTLAATPCLEHKWGAPFPLHAATGVDEHDLVKDDSISLLALMNDGSGSGTGSALHKSGLLGAPFAVRPDDTHITVTADAKIDQISLQIVGFGVTHAWAQLHLSISDGQTEIVSETMQLGSITTSGGTASAYWPGPQIDAQSETGVPVQLGCSFLRQKSDPVAYVMSLQGTVDVTSVGSTSAYAILRLTLDQLNAHACTS